MGTSLTGKQIKNTYKSLIKTSDSTEASATAKLLSDGNGNDFGVYIDTDGVFGIGSAPSYSLDVSSRTDGVALPVGTTANRPTPTNGLLRYNSTIGKIEFYDGGWKTVFTTSGGTIDGSLIVTGDLTIQGTTVTLNTETVQFEDNILLLNRADSDTQYDAINAGIEVEVTGTTNQSFLYTYGDSRWDLSDSLNIVGDLTVDTNTLYVDSADNRVGIGTLDPQVNLQVEGTIMNYRSRYSTNAGASYWDVRRDSSTGNFVISDDGLGDVIEIAQTTGNVGIGTASPSSAGGYAKTLQVSDANSASISVSRTTATASSIEIGTFSGSNLISSIGSGIPLRFNVDGSERMRIHSGGDVSFRDTSTNEAFYWDASAASLGIGTGSTVTGKFNSYVSATRQLTHNGNGGDLSIISDNNSTPVMYIKGTGTADLLQVFDNTSQVFTIKDGGNVGIGTTSPDAPLHVNGGSSTGFATVKHLELGFTSGRGLTISTSQVVAVDDLVTFDAPTATYGQMAFKTAGSERMRIASSGQVTTYNDFIVETASPEIYFQTGATHYRWMIAAQENVNAALEITPSTTAGGSTYSTPVAVFTASGNVGIGSTLPLSKIHIENTSGNDGIRIINSTTGEGYIIFGDTADNNIGSIAYNHTDDAMTFDVNNSERMRITSGGYLKASNTGSYNNASGTYHELISSTSDAVTLVLHNSSLSPYGIDLAYTGASPNTTDNYFLLCRDSSTNRLIVWSNGNIVNTNNSYGAISDIKLKENIVDASPKLDDLMQVKVRNYNLIGEETKQLGVVAQELEEVFPSMVSESPDFENREVELKDEDGNIVYKTEKVLVSEAIAEELDADGNVVVEAQEAVYETVFTDEPEMTTEKVDLGTTTKSVKYSVFVPMLIKAMQEQQEMINDLKARIENLENQ